jgi:hypothetical protein
LLGAEGWEQFLSMAVRTQKPSFPEAFGMSLHGWIAWQTVQVIPN